MKKLVFLLMMSFVLVAGTACSNNDSTKKNSDNSSDVAEVQSMTGEELEKQNSPEKKDEVLIIDVRSEDEYKAGHIPNAINIFVDDLENNLDQISDYKDKPVIVYCNSGNKSGQAAKILVDNGFKDVIDAEGVKKYDYDLVKYTDVRGAALEDLVKENGDMVLVDVRPADQAKGNMLKGAINVPFDAIEDNLDKLPKDKTIAVYCNTGTKSQEAAKTLEDLGYENVINSIEGVKEYDFSSLK